jgi:hypothetical protein
MKAAFAQVLAEETAALAAVTDAVALDRWREHLIDQAANAQSAYAKVLRPVGDPRQRAEFLDRWRDLIAAALARVVNAATPRNSKIDVHQKAVSILAALYGGMILSRVAKECDPLRFSVGMALTPLLPPADSASIQAEKWSARGSGRDPGSCLGQPTTNREQRTCAATPADVTAFPSAAHPDLCKFCVPALHRNGAGKIFVRQDR